MDNQFYDFVKNIGVMKPAHIKEDNAVHLEKMRQILSSSEYVAEEKIDGCHYLCYGGRFMSTENVEKTDNFPHLRDFFIRLGMPNIILDGEINYPGKTSQYCSRATGAAADTSVRFQNQHGAVHYTMWDILRTPKGTWLLNMPYKKRRAILEQFYNTYITDPELRKYIHLTTAVQNNKKDYFDSIIASGGEGCVLKNINSVYVMGKKPMWQWMKLKQKDEADLFIIGYKDATVEYNGKSIESWPYWKEVNGVLVPVTKDYYFGWVGALVMGAYVNGEVQQICTCAGLDENMKISLSENPDHYLGRVCKMSYMEKTEAGYPRHPRFESFHESKTSIECTWELE
ncbi:MAG: hypothetical protein R3Y58_02030 [Eubacteriales bacterium]